MKTGLHKTALLLLGLLASTLSVAQTSPAPPPVSAHDPQQIIKFLTKIVSWHRQLAAEQQIAEASDTTAVQENRRIADQVVQLGFEYARSQVQLQAKHPATPAVAEPQADNDTENQALVQAAQQAAKEVVDTEERAEGEARHPIQEAEPHDVRIEEPDEGPHRQSPGASAPAMMDGNESPAGFNRAAA